MFEGPADTDFSLDAPSLPPAPPAARARTRRSRLRPAQHWEAAQARRAAGRTQRQSAADCGVARSTLQDWCRRPVAGAAPAALAAFVETAEGVRWRQQLVVAAPFTITLQGGAGVRVVCEFLELSGLSAFVGASYGRQQALNVALEEAVVECARVQRAALVVGMRARRVTVCEDETFHPQICLVCIEPVSKTFCWNSMRPRPCGRPPTFAVRIQTALTVLIQAEADQAQARQTEARDLVRALGTLYHPYELEHGQAQSVAQFAPHLAEVWTRLWAIADAADLPTRAREQLAKAERLTTPRLATLAFFFATIQSTIEALTWPPALEPALFVHLIPALHLERAAARSTRAAVRRRLRALSAHLLEPVRQPNHPLQAVPVAERQRLEQVAGDCADLFQRSRSCVEGRNVQLALHHHGRHRLSNRKLAALTAVHNFHLRRPDGTTAAQRFFGRAHDAFFAQVLTRIPLPPRPARRRPCAPQGSRLQPVAAWGVAGTMIKAPLSGYLGAVGDRRRGGAQGPRGRTLAASAGRSARRCRA
jgi:hypothetical protein